MSYEELKLNYDKGTIQIKRHLKYCRTPVLGLGLGVEFTFTWDNNNNNNDNDMTTMTMTRTTEQPPPEFLETIAYTESVSRHVDCFCQTPVLGLGLGVDITFPNNKNKNPHLIFHRREGARGLKFGTQT